MKQQRPAPAIFISHGAPSLVIEPESATHDFLRRLGHELPRPRAIVCISAHWPGVRPTVTSGLQPQTIHDFYGFPQVLYQMSYPAPGDPLLAAEVVEHLARAGLDATMDEARGLDHGAWVPLKIMYPDADVPVVQLSVQIRTGPLHHLEMGRALQPLREQGVLILGSGGATHNLREFGRYPPQSAPVPYAEHFDQWLERCVREGRTKELLDYVDTAPQAVRNHPTPEHFLPLFVPLGAAGPDARGRRIHACIEYGILSMAAFAWD